MAANLSPPPEQMARALQVKTDADVAAVGLRHESDARFRRRVVREPEESAALHRPADRRRQTRARRRRALGRERAARDGAPVHTAAARVLRSSRVDAGDDDRGIAETVRTLDKILTRLRRAARRRDLSRRPREPRRPAARDEGDAVLLGAPRVQIGGARMSSTGPDQPSAFRQAHRTQRRHRDRRRGGAARHRRAARRVRHRPDRHRPRARAHGAQRAPTRTFEVKDVLAGNEGVREVEVPDFNEPVPLPNPGRASIGGSADRDAHDDDHVAARRRDRDQDRAAREQGRRLPLGNRPRRDLLRPARPRPRGRQRVLRALPRGPGRLERHGLARRTVRAASTAGTGSTTTTSPW